MSWVLKELSEAGRKIAQFIFSGVERGLSASEIIRTVREAGLGYRESEMRRDITIAQVTSMQWRGMRYIPREYIIRPEWYRPASTQVIERYMTTLQVRVFNTETGETETRHVSIKHDILKTRSELEETAMKMVEIASPYVKSINAYPVRAIRRA